MAETEFTSASCLDAMANIRWLSGATIALLFSVGDCAAVSVEDCEIPVFTMANAITLTRIRLDNLCFMF